VRPVPHHKYDPITQREYYQFLAFLNNADEPEIDVPDPRVRERREAVAAQIHALEAGRASKAEGLDAKLDAWERATPRALDGRRRRR